MIEYLKEFHKSEKELIKNVNRVNPHSLVTCGWNCRILLLGGSLPPDLQERNFARIRSFADACGNTGSEASGQEEGEEVKPKEEAKQVISIQERVANRANDLIAEIEVQLDNYYRDGTIFKLSDWMAKHEVKPAIAQRIAEYYKPLYSEVFDAYNGKDDQDRKSVV